MARNGGGKYLILNILYKIAIPSIVFSIINFFPKVLLRETGFALVDFLNDTVLGGSIWFTCALTVSEIIIFFILLFRVKNIYVYILAGVLLTLLANYISSQQVEILGSVRVPWHYKSGFIAVTFMAFGGLYSKIEEIIDNIQSKIKSILLFGGGMIFLTCTAILSINLNFELLRLVTRQLATGSINLPSFVWALFSIIILIGVCKKYKGNRLNDWVARHSIAFYFICGGVPNVLAIVVKRIFSINGNIYVLIVFSLSLATAFLVVWTLNKYTPFLFDMRLLKKMGKNE